MVRQSKRGKGRERVGKGEGKGDGTNGVERNGKG